jgi:CRP/FNR family transcriptional regulator, dissimilatory nitrate respiration regulator
MEAAASAATDRRGIAGRQIVDAARIRAAAPARQTQAVTRLASAILAGVIIDDLRRAPLFSEISEEQLGKLARIASSVTLPADVCVFAQGNRADAFYLLAAGAVKVAKTLLDGRGATIRYVAAGDTFGESVLFHDVYPSNAETLAPSRLCRFETEAFRDLMLTEPDLALVIIAAMARRLVMLNQRVEELLLPVPARLARYILELCDEQGTPSGCRLAFTKHELASRLGTVPETLSRTLTRLSAGHLIAVHGKDIDVVNLDGLERLAQQHWEARLGSLSSDPRVAPAGSGSRTS